MSENNLWFGYLDAGEKSSPVIMDPRLNTANPNTVYLFHFNRGEIIEYRRDIIETKLRTLESTVKLDKKALKSAYMPVRRNFVPRGEKLIVIPDSGAAGTIRPGTEAITYEEQSEGPTSYIDDEFSSGSNWEAD
jgi:hypothetical protein